MLSLDQTKKELRALIIEKPDQVFKAIKTNIPVAPKKMKMLMLLQGRYKDLINKEQKGVISFADQSLENNRIREQLLLWVDKLEEKDLVKEEGHSKKRKQYPLVALLTTLILITLIWAIWYLQPFGSMEKKVITDQDTAETRSSQPVSSPTIPLEDSSQALLNKTVDKPVKEVAKDQPKSQQNVHLKINVTSLWKDSDIMVDGKVVEPVERLGTYITLALSPGAHKIRLISGQDQCEKNIRVRKEGETILFNCD